MPEHDDELRALRERAYGPRADIGGDPGALTRLHELEAQSRTNPTALAEPPAQSWRREEPEPDASATAVEPANADPAEDERSVVVPADSAGPDGATPDRAVPRRRWWTGRIPLLWIGSVVVALVVGSIAASGIGGLVGGRVAVLLPDAEAEWPTVYIGVEQGEGVVFEEFDGLLVFAVPQSFGDAADGEGDARCIYIAPAGERGAGGMITAGCAVEPFSAVASFAVVAGSPEPLRDAFPLGTALQFTLDGDQVRVDAHRP